MSMEKRRSERLVGRFIVVVHEKLATWVTKTEDVSARGCRIELKRPLTPGMLVQLTFDMGDGIEPLVVHGQVAWARKSPPHSAGIAFLSVPRQAAKEEPAKAGDWIDRLLGSYVRRIEEEPAVVAAPLQTPVPTPIPGPAATPVPADVPAAGSAARVRPGTVIVPPAP